MSQKCIAEKYCPPAGMSVSVPNPCISPYKGVSMWMRGRSCQTNFISVNIGSARSWNSNRNFLRCPRKVCRRKLWYVVWNTHIEITSYLRGHSYDSHNHHNLSYFFNCIRFIITCIIGLITVAVRSKAWVWASCFLGLRVRIPPAA